MSIRAGVVRAVAFQQVDDAPCAIARTEGNHTGLKGIDCSGEKRHSFLKPETVGDSQIFLIFRQNQKEKRWNTLRPAPPAPVYPTYFDILTDSFWSCTRAARGGARMN